MEKSADLISPVIATDEGQKAQAIVQTTVRFVAFLDIMGFKERVARVPHEELLAQLTDFSQALNAYVAQYEDANIQSTQFSDSIILASNDASLESLKTLAEVVRGIMQIAVRRQIPMKGAMARGMVTCDTAKRLFFGQALIDAYLLEESVHYYGVLMHHTVETAIDELGIPSLFRDVKAPLKNGNISHYELSWYADNPDDPKQLENAREALCGIRQTVSDAPRKYIDNTLGVMARHYVPASLSAQG